MSDAVAGPVGDPVAEPSPWPRLRADYIAALVEGDRSEAVRLLADDGLARGATQAQLRRVVLAGAQRALTALLCAHADGKDDADPRLSEMLAFSAEGALPEALARVEVARCSDTALAAAALRLLRATP